MYETTFCPGLDMCIDNQENVGHKKLLSGLLMVGEIEEDKLSDGGMKWIIS